MDKEAIANLAIGGGVTGVFSYIVHIFTKKHDEMDILKVKMAQLEIKLEHLTEVQSEIKDNIQFIIDTLVQSNKPARSRARKEDKDAT